MGTLQLTRPLVVFDLETTGVNVDEATGCWLWQGARTAQGYGAINVRGRAFETTHRLAWLLFHGSIPRGMFVCHHCDVRHCFNPTHLFLGTNADNMRDAAEKGRVRNGGLRGERHGNAKLTEAQAREILSMRGRGLSARSVGERYGVGHSIVQKIWARKMWRHL